jgi:hypothetical protein
MTTKTIDHPLEDVLDIPSNSTEIDVIEHESKEIQVIDHPDYDDKDQSIDSQFQEVYDLAMDAFERQAEDAEIIEPKFRARTQEVAAQFLNTALNAAKEKSYLKVHKDKINIAKAKATGPQTVNNNLVVADRNELLKKMMGESNEEE